MKPARPRMNRSDSTIFGSSSTTRILACVTLLPSRAGHHYKKRLAATIGLLSDTPRMASCDQRHFLACVAFHPRAEPAYGAHRHRGRPAFETVAIDEMRGLRGRAGQHDRQQV